jgi:hypothetical protein
MVMLVLGLLLAAVVLAGVWVISSRLSSPGAVSYRARSAIRDIEQQTIHAMLAAELAAQRAAVETRRKELR